MATTTIELSGDEAKLFRSLQRVIHQQDRMEGNFSKVRRESQQAGQSARVSFDSAALAVSKYATGFGAVTTAIGFANSALREHQQLRDQVLQSYRGREQADRGLVQVAANAEDLRALFGTADSIAASSGITREQARQLVFSARSEGFEGALPFIAQNTATVSPEAAAVVAGQVPALFKGKITPQQAINATLAAAEASRLNFEQISTALPSAAQGAAMVGASPAETLATLSVLASRFKSGDEAATAMKAFATKAGLDERFKGRGFAGTFETLRGMSEADRAEFLGQNEQMNQAYVILAEEMETIRQRVAMVQGQIAATGTSRAVIAQKTAAAQTVIGARRQLGAMEQQLQVSREAAMLSAAVQGQETELRLEQDLLDRGVSPLRAHFERRVREGVTFTAPSAPTRVVGGLTRAAGAAFELSSPLLNAVELMRSAARDQQEAAQIQRDAAQAMEAAAGRVGGSFSRVSAQQREAASQASAVE